MTSQRTALVIPHSSLRLTSLDRPACDFHCTGKRGPTVDEVAEEDYFTVRVLIHLPVQDPFTEIREEFSHL